MRAILWIGTGILLLLLGGISPTRGFGRATLWLLVGSVGLGLCCVFLGILALPEPPVGDDLWVRLLWSTGAWTGPAWVGFSLHFARPERTKPGDLQRLLFAFLWIGATVLLVWGLSHPPVEAIRPSSGTSFLKLNPPVGRLFVVHGLAAMALMLWNLHATLETARAIGRRRTVQAIYAFLPVLVAGLYVLAEFLLYGISSQTSGDLLVGATLLSTVAVAGTVRRSPIQELKLPAGQIPRPSSAVLSGLGAFFVGLALLAESIRWLGRPSGVLWYERLVVALLVLILGLWIFPGLRGEIRRVLDRGGIVSFARRRDVAEHLVRALSPAERPADQAVALRALLRDRLGSVRVHLWVSGPLSEGFETPEDGGGPRLGPEHPLVTEMERRAGSLVLSGDATRLREIPLYTACEEIAGRLGVQVFVPVRHHGTLVAILGVGGSQGHALHPEDIDLLEEVAERLGPVLFGEEFVQDLPPGSPDEAVISDEACDDLEWLHALLPDQDEDRATRPLRLKTAGLVTLRRTPGFAEPLLRSLFHDAAIRAMQAGEPSQVLVEVLPRDRIQITVPQQVETIRIRLVDPARGYGPHEDFGEESRA